MQKSRLREPVLLIWRFVLMELPGSHETFLAIPHGAIVHLGPLVGVSCAYDSNPYPWQLIATAER